MRRAASQYKGVDGCWVFQSPAVNYAFWQQWQVDGLVAATQCQPGWWNSIPIDTSVPVSVTHRPTGCAHRPANRMQSWPLPLTPIPDALPTRPRSQVGGNVWQGITIPIAALGLIPGQCPDTSFTFMLAVTLTYVSTLLHTFCVPVLPHASTPPDNASPCRHNQPQVPSTPGGCPPDVMPGIAGTQDGTSLGCPSGCSLFYDPIEISCTNCNGV